MYGCDGCVCVCMHNLETQAFFESFSNAHIHTAKIPEHCSLPAHVPTDAAIRVFLKPKNGWMYIHTYSHTYIQNNITCLSMAFFQSLFCMYVYMAFRSPWTSIVSADASQHVYEWMCVYACTISKCSHPSFRQTQEWLDVHTYIHRSIHTEQHT